MPRSLSELVSARLAAVPTGVREVLEPVALLSEATVALVEAVIPERATVVGRLRTAEEAGILELHEERVRFSHPLPGDNTIAQDMDDLQDELDAFPAAYRATFDGSGCYTA